MGVSILSALKKHDNDYSKIESVFLKKTHKKLLSETIFPLCKELSVSVIVPAFKSNNTIVHVLKALVEQTFLKNGGKIEVIIIDDASPLPLFPKTISFEKLLNIKYIRKSKNEGAGAARDEAIGLASNDLLIFIDSDIVLPRNFISNHVFAHKFLSKNSILVSFRENIEISDSRLKNLKKWGNAHLDLGDHRNKIVFKKDWIIKPSDKKLVGKEFDVLRHSNFFKNFKANKNIDLWNLPMMVLTCAVSVKRTMLDTKNSVSKMLFGWGFNDTCLFAPIIARGAFVIPNLNSNVLHIIEEKHTKKNSLKNCEYKRNEKIFQFFIKKTFL